MTTVTDPTKDTNKTGMMTMIAVIVIGVLILGGLYFFLRNAAENRPFWDMSRDVPENLSVEYVPDDNLGHYVSFTTAEETDHIMDIFEDPSCGYCKDFTQEHGDTTNEKVASGELELNVHLMNFLDDNSGMTYSDDVGAVIIELAKDGDADNAWRVYNEIWENQPSTGTPIEDIPSMEDMINALRTSDEPVSDEVIQALETDPSDSGQRIYDSNITNTDALISTTNRVSTPTVFFDNNEQQFEIGDDEYFNGLFDN